MRSIAAAPHIFWAVLFIVLPLVIVVFYAFTNAEGIFSFENILSLTDYAPIFGLSIELAIIATAICLVIGYPLAYIIAKSKPKNQKFYIMLIMLPMWTNLLIRTYSIMALLDDGGFINSILMTVLKVDEPVIHVIGTKGAVIFGMVYDFLPYMVLPIYTCISKIDKHMWEAAQDLGCNEMKTFTKVTLPLSLPGVISGITMVFMPSVTTFFIPRMLGGGNSMMFGDLIELNFLTEGNWNVGSALSLIMMILIMISLGILRKADPEGEGGSMI